jgi:hypothetical protein
MCCDEEGLTGCGLGYACQSTYTNGTAINSCLFLPTDTKHEPAPQVLPRHKLCTVTTKQRQLHGLPIGSKTGSKLGYFSSMGSFEDEDTLLQHQSLTHIYIIVHGSGRNADDYLCGGISSVSPGLMQTAVMVIAPWFPAPGDNTPDNSSIPDEQLLRWNETGPIHHTWRYGAESMTDGVTSSYQTMDVMVERIMFDKHRFPNLQRIIVAGHSAGGQFTHRWILTSNSRIWRDSETISDDELVPIRVVAANPRSFCYLDSRRYNKNGELVEPTADCIANCPGYNQWEWGLETDGRVPMPRHVRKQIEEHGGDTTWLTQNYGQRDVVYLAGELDVLKVISECEDDDFQGEYRFERSKLYFDSLQEFYKSPTHHRLVVDGVNHEHCLMFQSEAGQQALFGDFSEDHTTDFDDTLLGSIEVQVA